MVRITRLNFDEDWLRAYEAKHGRKPSATAEDKPKRSKYNAQHTEVDGIMFDSKHEADRYCELKLMERAGDIKDLRLQVPFVLIPKQDGERAITYRADFVYMDRKGHKVVEDAKGVRTEVYKLKRKLMQYMHGIKIKEV